jgi:hypothetical protein
LTCAKRDAFATWFLNTDNLNQFAHLSHTFTHLELNNATYHDASREIHFNQAWMAQMGMDKVTRFSAHGLIPPAITGLHNAEVIKAWLDNGIYYVVGDNTRVPLRNPSNKFWPLISTVAANVMMASSFCLDLQRLSTTTATRLNVPHWSGSNIWGQRRF